MTWYIVYLKYYVKADNDMDAIEKLKRISKKDLLKGVDKVVRADFY